MAKKGSGLLLAAVAVAAVGAFALSSTPAKAATPAPAASAIPPWWPPSVPFPATAPAGWPAGMAWPPNPNAAPPPGWVPSFPTPNPTPTPTPTPVAGACPLDANIPPDIAAQVNAVLSGAQMTPQDYDTMSALLANYPMAVACIQKRKNSAQPIQAPGL